VSTFFIHYLWLGLEIFGTIIFAISGAMSAARRGFDVTGVVLIGCVVGNGGGTIRDLLIGAPVYWLTHWSYIIISIAAALLTFLSMHYVHQARRLILLSDALGLGVFAVVGAQKALLFGLNPFLAVIMGLITSIGGGLIRDTLCNQMPLVLREEIYALAATAGATVFVLLPSDLQQNFLAYMACVTLVVIIRLLAVKFKIHMPSINFPQD